jgi:O-succinylbenzoate synthase
VSFALETALLDYRSRGRKLLYDSDFTAGKTGIPINGLIWMGELEWMQQQIRQKLDSGFNCLKLKIGAHDFEQELQLLKQLRKEYPATELSIRVDANGAFSISEAEEKLQRLSEWELHSIEQPIKPGNWDAMARLCAVSPVPIALDEELIGPQESNYKKRLLYFIKPQYIILKPTLVGGIASTQEWIRWAEHHSIGWWLTSALESNIGLNAIAQFAATVPTGLPQGLGTGQLYTNNFPSPLTVNKGHLYHHPDRPWDISTISA